MTSREKVESLLGEQAFLVPCEWGTKKPLLTYVERPFEATKTVPYRAVFEVQDVNIAVYLGKASSGLCAIDFDRDEDVQAFLAVNPGLANTTRSRGSRGAMLWVRIDGEYPESCNPDHKHFEWRADKRLSTIYGRHPSGIDYQLLCDAPPVTVRFADIVWPEGWALPWVECGDAKLKRLYGEPFYTNEKGGLTGINEAYWAGLHASENEILFDKDEKTFYKYDKETGLYAVETEDSIRARISSRMLEASRPSERVRSAEKAHVEDFKQCGGPFAWHHGVLHALRGAPASDSPG